MYTPVVGFTVTVAPPADVADALYDKARPAGSVNGVDPVTAPESCAGVPEVEVPAVGMPASQVPFTVTVLVAVLTPLEAVTVNVSMELDVAAWRCA